MQEQRENVRPFLKEMLCIFMPEREKKRRQGVILSSEQSFCLDLNSDWNLLFYRLGTQFLLFYGLHKLYACAQSSYYMT